MGGGDHQLGISAASHAGEHVVLTVLTQFKGQPLGGRLLGGGRLVGGLLASGDGDESRKQAEQQEEGECFFHGTCLLKSAASPKRGGDAPAAIPPGSLRRRPPARHRGAFCNMPRCGRREWGRYPCRRCHPAAHGK